LARDAQAKLALIVAQILSICPSVCLSVRDSLSAALRIASHIDYRLVHSAVQDSPTDSYIMREVYLEEQSVKVRSSIWDEQMIVSWNER